MGYIYKVTNTINGKVYIGQTIRTIPVRWEEHVKYSFSSVQGKSYNSILHRAIRKYGADAFTVEEVEQCDDEFLSERETYWIRHYDSTNRGYNVFLGAKGYHKCRDEDILCEWNKGKPIKEIAKVIPLHPETISKKLQKYGITHQDIKERSQKLRVYPRGIENPNSCKNPIYQYDLDGNFLKEFPTKYEAEHSIGTKINTSPQVYGNTFGGYQWRTYKTDNIGASKMRLIALRKESRQPTKPYRRKVVQFTTYWRYINSYESIKDAAISIDGSERSINHVLVGLSKTSGGYCWMYLEDAERLGLVI